MMRIEVQDQFGQWLRCTKVANTPSSIKFGLQTVLKTQLASKPKEVRAVDGKTAALVDVLQG